MNNQKIMYEVSFVLEFPVWILKFRLISNQQIWYTYICSRIWKMNMGIISLTMINEVWTQNVSVVFPLFCRIVYHYKNWNAINRSNPLPTNCLLTYLNKAYFVFYELNRLKIVPFVWTVFLCKPVFAVWIKIYLL